MIFILGSYCITQDFGLTFQERRGKFKPQINKLKYMSLKSKNFGEFLKDLRIKKELSLRDVCKLTKYDPSNWSKIERGKICPPCNEEILRIWAKVLDAEDIQAFIDRAMLSQGMLPRDVFSNNKVVEHLPAFFRTLRNKKPTRKEVDNLIELIKKDGLQED